MSAPVIQSTYDQLDQAARTFDQAHDHMRQASMKLAQKVGVLRNGGWIAEGAAQFYQEFDQDIHPALMRLESALEEAAQVIREIIRILQAAEEEAAAQLRGDDTHAVPDRRYGVSEFPMQVPTRQDGEVLSTGVVQGSQGGGNIRLEPDDSTNNVIRFAANGESLSIIGVSEDGDWFYVQDEEGNFGWIADYIFNQGNAANLPIYNPDGILRTRSLLDMLINWGQPSLQAIANYGLAYTEAAFNVELTFAQGEQITFETLGDILQLNLGMSEMRDAYGMTFTQEEGKVWQPWEILAVYNTVATQATRVNTLAESAGYDLSQINPYRVLFGNRVITRSVTHNYGYATGSTIHLGDGAFYQGTSGIIGNRLSPENPGGFRADHVNAGEHYIPEALAGHEITHIAAFRDAFIPMVNNNGIINLNWNLDSNYGSWSQSYTFNKTIPVTYTDSEGVVQTGTIEAGTEYEFTDDDAGWMYIGASSDNIAEQSTDALNAYAMNLYTIGPDFTLQGNIAGYGRMEQGKTLMYRLFEDRFGPPNDSLSQL